MGGMGRSTAFGLWVALALIAGAPAVRAQAAASASPGRKDVVAGTVRDQLGRPISGAQLRWLSDTASTVETDALGAFRIAPKETARLEVRRLGFRPETVSVSSLATAPVVLQRVGIVLDPVFVHGRRDVIGPLAGFYRRMSQGQGRFFTQEQIEQRNASRMSDFFRGIPGIRIDQRRTGGNAYRIRGAQALPIFWLDGMALGAGEIDVDAFDPRTFAAIEVYSGPATVPPEFTSARSLSGAGGVIVLWTRQGQQGARRRRPGDPSPAQVLAGLIARRDAWPIDSVDTPAALVGGGPLVPIYPDSLFTTASGGQVEVEFVVGADGLPQMETFGAISSSHLSLIEAVRRSVEGRKFSPATRKGLPVPMLMQVPFAFVPDSSQVRRASSPHTPPALHY